jgi:TatD DNase family protein
MPTDWKIHLHCWTGENKNFAKKLLEKFPNMYIGFTGVITFQNCQKVRDVIQELPLGRILVETDGPYMAPEGYRGEKVIEKEETGTRGGKERIGRDARRNKKWSGSTCEREGGERPEG